MLHSYISYRKRTREHRAQKSRWCSLCVPFRSFFFFAFRCICTLMKLLRILSVATLSHRFYIGPHSAQSCRVNVGSSGGDATQLTKTRTQNPLFLLISRRDSIKLYTFPSLVCALRSIPRSDSRWKRTYQFRWAKLNNKQLFLSLFCSSIEMISPLRVS